MKINALCRTVRLALYREAERRGMSVFDLLAMLTKEGE